MEKKNTRYPVRRIDEVIFDNVGCACCRVNEYDRKQKVRLVGNNKYLNVQ